MPLHLYNTLSKKREAFSADGPVGLYSCGPTVYASPQIGNLRAYVFSDTLRRTLEAFGHTVTQVINITDVGHLTTDADAGEDKLQKSATQRGANVWDIARMFEDEFVSALSAMHCLAPHHLPRATEHIQEQADMIEALHKKGFTYVTDDGIYFDTSKDAHYGCLSGQHTEDKKTGARVVENMQKKHPADFALWKFCVGANATHAMRWENPLGIEGEGFPGWHIECSAMSAKYLGVPFHIHTGGVDHIPVHHENELAQTRGACGHTLAHIWMHCNFLTVEGGKMSKSLGNLFTLSDLATRGFSPADFRYLCLSASYQSQLDFTWTAMEGAKAGLLKLTRFAASCTEKAEGAGRVIPEKKEEALEAVGDNLNTPKLLAVMHSCADISSKADALATLYALDDIAGLNLKHAVTHSLPIAPTAEQKTALTKRAAFRQEGDYAAADVIREDFLKEGIRIEDGPQGSQTLYKA